VTDVEKKINSGSWRRVSDVMGYRAHTLVRTVIRLLDRGEVATSPRSAEGSGSSPNGRKMAILLWFRAGDADHQAGPFEYVEKLRSRSTRRPA